MINNTTSETSSLAELSFELLRQNLSSGLPIIFLCLMNLTICIAMFCMISRSEFFNSQTFAYVKLFCINDLLFSVYEFFVVTTHLIYLIMGKPELISQRNCYYLIGFTLFFWRNNEILSLLISIDRMKSTIRPSVDNSFVLSAVFIVKMLAILGFSVVVHVVSMFDNFDDKVLPLCTTTDAMGSKFKNAIPLFNSFIGLLTCIVYIVVLIYIRCKLRKIEPSNNSQNSLAEKQKITGRRISMRLAFLAFVHFVIGPLFGATLTIFYYSYPQFYGFMKNITVWMLFVGGTFYSMFFLSIKEFRNEFNAMYFNK